MKILAFGASYSAQSINKRLAAYVAGQFEGQSVEVMDLRQFDLPVFTVDVEAEMGHPEKARRFVEKLEQADLLIISMAEHNGSYTAAFKNLFDWASRINPKMFDSKKMLLLSTSPGPRGGVNALAAATDRFPRHGAIIAGTFSLPEFFKNFDEHEGIKDALLNEKLMNLINSVKENSE